MEDVVAIHDPQILRGRLAGRFLYNLRMTSGSEDYVCGQPHRDLSSVAACGVHEGRRAASGRRGARGDSDMSDDLKFQLRLTMSDQFAKVARSDPQIRRFLH